MGRTFEPGLDLATVKLHHLGNFTNTKGCGMMGRNMIAVYGRAGLIIAAFVLIAGIITAPILPRVGAPVVTASTSQNEPTIRLPITPASLPANYP
jgi:hypothetical protein